MSQYNKNPRDLLESPGARKDKPNKYNISTFSSKNKPKKTSPYYLAVLQKFPQANPIFVALSRPCFDYIIGQQGPCVLCNYSVENYDLAFCQAKEIWLLAINDNEISKAKNFILPLLDQGAAKVLIVLFNVALLEGLYE